MIYHLSFYTMLPYINSNLSTYQFNDARIKSKLSEHEFRSMRSDLRNDFYRKNAYVVPEFLTKIETCNVDDLPGNITLGDFIKKQHDISHVTIRDISLVRNEQQVIKKMLIDLSTQVEELKGMIAASNATVMKPGVLVEGHEGVDQTMTAHNTHTKLTFETLWQKNNEKKNLRDKILHFWEYNLQEAYEIETRKDIKKQRKTWLCNIRKCADYVLISSGQSPELTINVPNTHASLDIKEAWKVELQNTIDDVLKEIIHNTSINGKPMANLTVTSMCAYIRSRNGTKKRKDRNETDNDQNEQKLCTKNSHRNFV